MRRIVLSVAALVLAAPTVALAAPPPFWVRYEANFEGQDDCLESARTALYIAGFVESTTTSDTIAWANRGDYVGVVACVDAADLAYIFVAGTGDSSVEELARVISDAL
jgi:hypothetical protein